MKSKKIVALALVAAMSISMASMTAFAATRADYKQVNVSSDENVTKEAYAFAFKEGSDGKVKYFVFEEGTDKSSATSGDTTTTSYKLSADQVGGEDVSVTFGMIKSKLSQHDNDADSGVKFVGWSVDNAANSKNTPAEADKTADELKILKDDVELADGTKGTKDSPLVLNEVWQTKNQSDLDKDAIERNNRPRVAKLTKAGSDWEFTAQQITGKVVSKAKGTDEGADAIAKKCNTTADKCRIYDVKPFTKADIGGDNADKEVALKKGTQVDVVLPLTGVGTYADKDAVNKAIKEGKLKVFHIGSDNKSHPVSGVSAADAANITFKYGTFSDFVVTADKDAKAQAGEEEGASAGNPATGEASALPVAMLALAALSATGVVAYKKRKAE